MSTSILVLIYIFNHTLGFAATDPHPPVKVKPKTESSLERFVTKKSTESIPESVDDKNPDDQDKPKLAPTKISTTTDLERFLAPGGSGTSANVAMTSGKSGLYAFTGFFDIGAVDPKTSSDYVAGFYFDHRTDSRGNRGNALIYSLLIPMNERVDLKVQSHYSWATYTQSVADELGLDDQEVSGGGDINLLLRYNFLLEGEKNPGLTLLIGMKTSTGSVDDGYTDSMGGSFGLTAAKNFQIGDHDDWIQSIGLVGSLLFATHDTDKHQQDDLGMYGFEVNCRTRNDVSVGVGIGGAVGWLPGDVISNPYGYVGFPLKGKWRCKIGGSVATNDNSSSNLFTGIEWGF